MRSNSRVPDVARPCSARRTHGFAFCVAMFAMLVIAAAATSARGDDDLPGRVGRVADFGGQLYLSAQDRPDDWTPIGVNYPVTSGDNLWVSTDGRAEVDYGGGQFRLAGNTNLNVARLDDRQLTLFVARGRLIVRIRVLDTDDVARIDTPNTQIALTRPGLYRIDVTPDGSSTTVNVREGESLVGLATGAQQALPGQSVTVSGMEPLAADIRNGFGVDGFDTWSANRDRYYERARSTPYVSRQMVGYAELDQYGSWEDNPMYGAVWYPAAVAPDWVPYQDGYWTSVGAWGLTWVDAAPWGYAPSHYGRWVREKGRWGWCPGAPVARPHWAPALVGWYGGAGWGITANGGAPVYGWVPLGWGDAYSPWWRSCSQNCWNRYNTPFAVNPADRANPRARYSYLDLPSAMTAVPGATLVGRKPVGETRVPLPVSQLASAPLLATPPSISPAPIAGHAFRPGERGTPTPASALYSNARRTIVVMPAPKGAAPMPTATAPAAIGTAAVPPQSPGRVRPAPVLAAPAQAAGPSAGATGQAPPTPTTGVNDAHAVRRAPGSAPIEPATRSGSASGMALPVPSPVVPTRAAPNVATPVPRTGIALPPPAVIVPPTGIALPPPAVIVPPTGIALPPASVVVPSTRSTVAAPQAQPAAVVVLPPASAVVVPADHAVAPKGAGDADARGARAADRAPVVVPAPASPR